MPDCQQFRICEAFQREASWTWNRLSSAEMHHADFHEPTITHSILLSLQEQMFPNLMIRAFTQPAESVYGADFLMCFSDWNKQYVSILFQAKRLFSPRRSQGGVARYNNLDPTGNQITDLENCARRNQITPLYLLYNGEFYYPRDPHYYRCDQCHECYHNHFIDYYNQRWRHGNRRYWRRRILRPYHSYDRSLQAWGCSVATLSAVRNSKQNSPGFDAIWPMKPWHLIFDGPMPHRQNALPVAVAAGLRRIHAEAEYEEKQKPVYIRKKPPEILNLATSVWEEWKLTEEGEKGFGEERTEPADEMKSEGEMKTKSELLLEREMKEMKIGSIIHIKEKRRQ